MRRIRTMLLAILCFSGLAVAQKLACQFDRGIDFSRFKAYQWVTVADNSAPGEVAEELPAERNEVTTNKRKAGGRWTASGVMGAKARPLSKQLQAHALEERRKYVKEDLGFDWLAELGSALTAESPEH